jgi:hypothetical protein
LRKIVPVKKEQAPEEEIIPDVSYSEDDLSREKNLNQN